MGVYGDKLARTPVLDALGKQSHVFERAYTNQAVCVASRYNLLLGSRSTSTGLYDFGRAFREAYPNAVTLPEHFLQEGYHTEAIGKVFHVGHNTYNDEQSWSVPHHYDFVVEYADKTHQGQTREEALFGNVPWSEANKLEKGPAWERLDVPDETYADGRVAIRAAKRLDTLAGREQPFFLAVGFARPHLPFTVPKKYWDLYDRAEIPIPKNQKNPASAPPFAVKRDGEILQYKGIPSAQQADPFPDSLTRKLIHGYYAGVSYVDAQIGKVLDQLKQSGLDKNTIVVVWGDHGYLLGEMGMWTKHVNYELANRIPLIIHHPDSKTNLGNNKELIETVDIYPTLVELCGLPTPNVEQPWDGQSARPLFDTPGADFREFVYHCFPRDGMLGRAIRDSKYRLIEWTPMDGKGETVYELYEYQDELIEKENIWRMDHPAFQRLKTILDQQPAPLAMRPASKPRTPND